MEETKLSLPPLPGTIVPDPDQVAIRTMKDDLKDITKMPSSPAKPAAPVPPKVKVPVPLPPPSANKSAPPQIFPLPPKQKILNQKTIKPPPPKPRGRRSIKIVVSLLILIIVAVAAFSTWWILTTPAPESNSSLAVSATELLPESATLIIRYNLSAPTTRADIETLWQSIGATSPSITSLLAGDPRLLLADQELAELYYVLLKGEARPYLVVPQTTLTSELFFESFDAKVTAHDDWFIIHPFDTTPYLGQMGAGTLTNDSNTVLLQSQTGEATPLSLRLGPALLTELRSELLGPAWAISGPNTMTLQARLPAGQAGLNENDLQFMGQFSGGSATASATSTDQQLLTLIPADAVAIHLGTNFASEVTSWQSQTSPLDNTYLEPPVVQKLLNDLNASYAYYTRLGEDGTSDTGLIIALPPDTVGSEDIGPALEAGLPALLPLILDPPPPAGGADTLAWTANTYQDIAHRFVNFVGQTITLDYALTDTHLLIATSKEGMFALLDTVTGNAVGFSGSPDSQPLFTAWGALPTSTNLLIGSLKHPELQSLLPITTIGLALTPAENTTTISGVALLGTKE